MVSGDGEVYVLPYQQSKKPIDPPTREDRERVVKAAREYFVNTAVKLGHKNRVTSGER